MRKVSKLIPLFLVLLFFAPLASHSETKEERIQRVLEFRQNIFARHLDGIISERETALLECMSISNTANAPYFTLQSLRMPYRHSQKASVPNILKLLDAYRVTEKILFNRAPCAKFIKASNIKRLEAERKKFKWAYKVAVFVTPSPLLSSPLLPIIAELDPNCPIDVLPNFDDKTADSNPCLAGAYPVLRAMRDPGIKKNAERFIAEFGAQIQNAQGGDRIHFDSLPGLSTNTPKERRRLLALITFFYSATTSKNGWVDQFGEFIWKHSFKLGNNSLAIYKDYMSWHTLLDYGSAYRNKAAKLKVDLFFADQNISSWNHHDFISAFLACDYQTDNRRALARMVPQALGYLYEAKDFVGHRRDGVSWKNSVDNFNTDTKRHNDGAKFGINYCSGN